MNGLKIGDMILDPSGLIYLSDINAVVGSGLTQSYSLNSALRDEILLKIQKAIKKYEPKFFIILDSPKNPKSLEEVYKNFVSKLELIFVSNNLTESLKKTFDEHKIEFHEELIWDQYCFVENTKNSEFSLFTISGDSNYYIKVGRNNFDPFGMFTGEKLKVFIRGGGRLKIPSLNPNLSLSSVLVLSDDMFFNRCDVFAIGHSRVLPLGKISEIKKVALLDTIPTAKKVLEKGKNNLSSLKALKKSIDLNSNITKFLQ
jgi:hypothetical protein